jgi:molybdenum cofactor cytidylyltransferase
VASLRNLKAALPRVVAVVRQGDERLREALEKEGAQVVQSADAALGMGHSLADAVRASLPAAGWVIALGDMPFISPATIREVALAIERSRGIAQPARNGERGHPVGFAGRFQEELLRLTGDEGARHLLGRHAAEVELLDTADAGVLRDIDSRTDLPG